MPPYEFMFESTPQLAKQAAGFMIWRRAGRSLVFMCLAMIALCALITVGRRGWYLYVALGVGVSRLCAWFTYYKKSAQPFAELSDPSVKATVDEEGIELQLATGGSRIAWNAPISLHISERLWLLGYFGDRTYAVIPTSCLEGNVQEYIKRNVLAGGGTVR